MSARPTLTDAAGTLWRFGMHLVEAAPFAWRQDRLFRITSVGTGVTLAVLLLHLAGPHVAQLEQGGRHYDPAARRIVPDRPDSAPFGLPTESEVPRITPGQPLGAAPPRSTSPSRSDRFGTFSPAPQRQP